MMNEIFQNPLNLAGWLLCASVVVWVLLTLTKYMQGQRRLRRQFEKEDSLLEEKFNLLRARRKQVKSRTESWEGFANFVLVKRTDHEGSGICSFYLKPRDARLDLASFLPGQHLVFQLPVEGLSQPITRRYSLSDRSGKDYYRVSVKLQAAPADVPSALPGQGSSYFHQNLIESGSVDGETLIQVSSPAGSFSLDPLDSAPVVLIGGGVGVTPVLSMFNSIVEENKTREVWLFYTIRNESENILLCEDMLHPECEELLAAGESAQLHVFYSQVKSPDALPANDQCAQFQQHCGRLTVQQLKEQLPSNNYRFYVCGPEAMMDQIEQDLEAWGVPEEDILSERFQPPSKRKSKAGAVAGRKIKFTKSGKEIELKEDDNNILDAAERAGVPIAYDCRAGSCGQCKVPLVSGKVDYNIRTNYKCAPGSCLACSCLPDGDVVLDC